MLPQVDQAIMLQGKSMITLINKGLHSDSDTIKGTVEQKYGQRGLNIVNMLEGERKYLGSLCREHINNFGKQNNEKLKKLFENLN